MMRRVNPAESSLDGRFRPRRLIGCLLAALALILCVFLLARVWFGLAGKPEPAAAVKAGAVLVLGSRLQPEGQYRLMLAGLAETGYDAGFLDLPADPAEAARQLQDQVERLASAAACAPGQVWLLAAGAGAPEAWRLGSGLKAAAGLILLAPQGLSRLTDQELQQWPQARAIAMFTGAEPSRAEEWDSRDFFERISGEDAALFPPSRQGPGWPSQYISSNGKSWLLLYPGLQPAWILLSPRVLPDVAGWLADWALAGGMPINGDRNAAGRQIVSWIFQLLLAGLLLLILPLALNLALSGPRAFAGHPDGSDRDERQIPRLAWIADILLWLPAMALAAAMGLLIAWLANRPAIGLFIAVALLPGCRGWLLLLVRLIRARWLQNDNADDELPEEKNADLVPAAAASLRTAAGLAGLILLPILIFLAGCWSWLAFGLVFPAVWPWVALPLLVFLNWPAGLAGTVGQIGVSTGNGWNIQPVWQQAIWEYLPFLLLPIWTALALGWPGFCAGMLLLAIQLWSVSLGKSAMLLLHRPVIGSLIQSLAYVSGIMLPPLLLGLAVAS